MAKATNDGEGNSAMDYPEHERTYDLFLTTSKWVAVLCAALMVSMAAGFFGGMGLVGGILIFIVLSVIAYFLI
jgi:hypothetical protein